MSTVATQVIYPDGTFYASLPVLFTLSQSVSLAGGKSVLVKPIIAMTDVNGNLSQTLQAGQYSVEFASGDELTIWVPDNSLTYNLGALSLPDGPAPQAFGMVSFHDGRMFLRDEVTLQEYRVDSTTANGAIQLSLTAGTTPPRDTPWVRDPATGNWYQILAQTAGGGEALEINPVSAGPVDQLQPWTKFSDGYFWVRNLINGAWVKVGVIISSGVPQLILTNA